MLQWIMNYYMYLMDIKAKIFFNVQLRIVRKAKNNPKRKFFVEELWSRKISFSTTSHSTERYIGILRVCSSSAISLISLTEKVKWRFMRLLPLSLTEIKTEISQKNRFYEKIRL